MSFEPKPLIQSLGRFLTQSVEIGDDVRDDALRWLQRALGQQSEFMRVPQTASSELALKMNYVGGQEEYRMRTRRNCAMRRVQIDLYSKTSGNLVDKAAEAVGVILGGFCSLQATSGLTWGGLTIRTCVLDAPWLGVPAHENDASDEWRFRLTSTWLIVYDHALTLAEGVVTKV